MSLEYSVEPDHYNYNDMPDFGDMDDMIAEAEEFAEKPFFVEAPSSFVENFDTMEIEDEEEEEQVLDLSERTTATTIKTTSVSIIKKKKTKVQLKPPSPSVKKVIDYTMIPETGAFVTATCPTTGLNVYFSKKSVGESKNKKDAMFKELTSKGTTTRGLLSKPLWQLTREIEKENAEKLALIEK